MKRIAVFLMLLMAVTAAKAQEATVKRVEPLANEVIVAADRRKDLNDSYCALVRVEVLADDVQFSGNIVGPVEHRTGHYRVFVSPGTRFLRIESGTFLPIMIDTREYGIQGMQSNCTYVVTLSLPSAAPAPASAGMNYLVMTVTPANARVTVDGKEREVRNGSVKVLLSNGTYTYRVEAPGYLPDEGSVTINNARADRTVALRSNKGTLAVSSATPGTEIYVNGERVGAGSWRGELLPDNYLVEGRLAGHRTTEQVVAVATGQTATVTLPALTAITGSLNIDYEPVGAKITIDGTDRGTTPAVIDNLTVGTHTVTLSAPDYTPQTLTPTIAESQMATLTGSLTQATNLNWFKDEATGKWGYKDENGKIVIPAKYDVAWDFSEGLALVTINGKYGFIDKNDNMVIPAKYDGAWPFSEGLALVTINGKYGFIDKNDNMVIPAKYDAAGGFYEGLAPVEINGKIGIIDKNDNMVIPAKYDDIWNFYEGLAAVKINGKWGFIDKNDNMVIPAKYDGAWPFSEGLAKMQINGKIGFIDKNDNMVIPAKYDDASGFYEGLAAVKINGKEGFINKNGKFVIPAKYDNTWNFSEGLAAVKINGKWGFIDKNENIVIPAKYDNAWPFENGKAKVTLNNIVFYIDKNGKEVR